MKTLAFSTPNVPAPGNHDLHRSPNVDASGLVFEISALWNAHFALPSNGPAGLSELAGQNYYLDYQGVRVIVIDVNAFANDDYVEHERARVRKAQVRWLRQVLGTNANRWTIVVQHQPIFPVVKNRDFPKMRATLRRSTTVPFDLVLQGHDHVYARTHKVFGGKVAGPAAPGTIYVIAVSGSKMNAVSNPRPPLMAVLRDTPRPTR